MKLTSSAFVDGRPIPVRHTADGADVSPPLAWADVPPGTVSLAVLADDPDAPGEAPWVHWLIYGIEPPGDGIGEGVPREPSPPALPGAHQGLNSFSGDRIGYRGPAPPRGDGAHRYRFTLHALDARPELEPGASRSEFLRAIRGHVVATSTLTGLYGR